MSVTVQCVSLLSNCCLLYVSCFSLYSNSSYYVLLIYLFYVCFLVFMFCLLFCVCCFFALFCVLFFPHAYNCLFSIFVQFTDHCQLVETQLQLANIISYIIYHITDMPVCCMSLATLHLRSCWTC